MKFGLGLKVAGVGGLGGIEGAEVARAIVDFDKCSPSLAIFCDAEEAAFVVPSDAAILRIFPACCVAQIVGTVFRPLAVFVVDLFIWPASANKGEDNPVGPHKSMSTTDGDADMQIAMAD